MNEYVILLLWFVITDPIRDITNAEFHQKSFSLPPEKIKKYWLKSHLAKWAQFYPTAIFLWLKGYESYSILLPLILWGIWWLSAFAFKVHWKPFWYLWLKNKLFK